MNAWGAASLVQMASTTQSFRTAEMSSIGNWPFLRDSWRLFSTFPVSADIDGLSGGF